jgi:hypothetical protein
MTKAASSSRQAADKDGDLATLYRRAFATYRTRALWNLKEFDEPTVEQALQIARHLRIEGDMEARCLAEQIEQAASADL